MSTKTYEPAHDKTYSKTYVTNKYQPVHPPSMARVLVHPSLDSLEDVEGTLQSAKTLIRLCRCTG